MLVRLAAAAIVAVASTARAAPIAVAVDLSRLDAPALRPTELLGQLVGRLVEAGFALVAPEGAPAIQVELARVGDELVASATGGGRTTYRRVALDDAVGEVQLEVALTVVEQVRELAASVDVSDDRPRPASRPAAPVPGPAPAAIAKAAPAARSPSLAVSLGAGHRARVGHGGPLVDLRARLGDRLAIEVGLDRATSDAGGVSVTEWGVRAGPSLSLVAAGPLEVRAALAIGAASHAFEVAPDVATVAPDGDRLDLVAALGLSAELHLGRWSVAVALTGAAADQARRHLAGDRVLWSAGRTRLDTTVCLGADL